MTHEDGDLLSTYYADQAELERLWATFDRAVSLGVSEMGLEAFNEACSVLEERIVHARQQLAAQGVLPAVLLLETPSI